MLTSDCAAWSTSGETSAFWLCVHTVPGCGGRAERRRERERERERDVLFFVLFFFIFYEFVFCLFRAAPWHVEFPRLGAESELQLSAYATSTAMPDLNRICDLHHSSRQHQILNSLGEARDRT